MFSSNPGRYAICAPYRTVFDGTDFDALPYPDLTAGMLIEVNLGGQWIPGTVQFGAVYVVSGAIADGYYFVARGGSAYGLCWGMEVRIP